MKKLKSAPKLTEDEVWLKETAGIKKLKQPEIPEQSEAPLIIDEVRQSINYSEAYHGSALARLDVGNFDNVDKRTAEKFRKGEFRIERRLDLHGLTEKEAFESVSNFIRNAYMQNLRCVLVITGKGINKDTDNWYDKKGILREAMPQWLNHPELRPLILAASPAKIEDGGSGALYILLRRHRSPSAKKLTS